MKTIFKLTEYDTGRVCKLAFLDDVYDRVVNGRDYGDLYVNNTRVIGRDKKEMISLLIPDKVNEIDFRTYCYDDDNELLTCHNMYQLKFCNIDNDLVSTVKVSQMKTWLNTLDDDDDISFYTPDKVRYYPVKMHNLGGNVEFTLHKSDDQIKPYKE